VLAHTSGFVYYVSIAGITGTKAPDLSDVKGHVGRIKAQTSLPVAVGFGVKTEEQVSAIAGIADAVVVGSALVNTIAQSLDGEGRATSTTKLKVFNLVSRLAAALRHPAEAAAL
jgi:tryptophan synthase alpha chain